MELLEISLCGSQTATFRSGQPVHIVAKIGRKRRARFDPGSCSGVREAELRRVEKLPRQCWHFGLARAKMGSSSIQNVSDQRMLYRGKVYSDLMRPSRMELDFEESRRPQVGECVPFGERFSGTPGEAARF